MKTKTLLILVGILGVAAILAALFLHSDSPRQGKVKMGQILLPRLDVNAVSSIEITKADGSFTLARHDSGWVVRERNNYSADFDKISEFLRKLVSVKIGRAFTANEKTTARMHLVSPRSKTAEPGHMGTLFSFADKDGKSLTDVLVGDIRKPTAEKGLMAGQYVKVNAKERIFLVDQSVGVIEQEPADWLEKAVIQIDGLQVKKLICRLEQKDRKEIVYSLFRPQEGADFVAETFDSARHLDTDAAEDLAGALGSLVLEDVYSAGENTNLGAGPVVEYHMFDGTVYKVYPRLHPEGNKPTLSLRVAYVKPDEAAGKDESKDAEEEKTLDPKEVEAMAKAENERVSPWIYKVSGWRFSTIVTQAEKLAVKEESQE